MSWLDCLEYNGAFEINFNLSKISKPRKRGTNRNESIARLHVDLRVSTNRSRCSYGHSYSSIG